MKDLNYWKKNAEEDYITTPISVLRYITELENTHETKQLNIGDVMQWVSIKDSLPNNDKQVLVMWDNGRFGINEYWQNDNCWKYNNDKIKIEQWCEIKPPFA